MLGIFLQIDTKEFYRDVFDAAWKFILMFKRHFLIIIGTVLLFIILPRFLRAKKFLITFIIVFILVLVIFFIWLYS